MLFGKFLDWLNKNCNVAAAAHFVPLLLLIANSPVQVCKRMNSVLSHKDDAELVKSFHDFILGDVLPKPVAVQTMFILSSLESRFRIIYI